MKILIEVTEESETEYSFMLWGRKVYCTPFLNPEIYYQIKEERKAIATLSSEEQANLIKRGIT